jgi:hypothetical protein
VQANSGEANWDWWNQSDLYFYSYESRRFSIDEHVGTFSRFLEKVFPTPRSLFAAEDADLRLTSGYRELYLVGHSLGAVVVRKAVLDRATKSTRFIRRLIGTSDPLMNARLRLFAPAMLGFRPSNWLGFCSYMLREIPGVGDWFRAALESQSIIQQLNPESREIQELKTGTEGFAKSSRSEAFVAHVIFGEDEDLVTRGKYAYDEIGDPIPDQDHRSVCKPTASFSFPLQFIEKGIHYAAKRHSAG